MSTIEDIEACLPQTQCGLCQYTGCKPYAEAIHSGEADIGQCPPGGLQTLKALAVVTKTDPTPFVQDVQAKQKPRVIAKIIEAECIGCTKCIQACPVDAILGAAKVMHTVIDRECSGCELCIEPCPMDCIVLEPAANPEQPIHELSPQFSKRTAARDARLAQLAKKEDSRLEVAQEPTSSAISTDAIAACVARAKKKKQNEFSL